MPEKMNLEYQELVSLEASGQLEEDQKGRLEELKSFDSAFKLAEEKEKDLKSALAQKDHFREKLEKEALERKALEEKLNKSAPVSKSLDVEDYIDISASLEGLDQREKQYLATQHKLTGQSLAEIRNGEDFAFWQGSYRQKVEKEKLAITPSNGRPEDDKPVSLAEALAAARTPQEKEEILKDAGLYTESQGYRSDRTKIGQ